MRGALIATFVVLSMYMDTVHCYSRGAPESVCSSMAPNRRSHGALPKSNSRNVDNGFGGPVYLYLNFFDRFVHMHSQNIKWLVNVEISSRCYYENHTIFRSKNITIETKDPDDRFKGFMLQIHYDADRYDRNFPFGPIGKFTVSPNSPYKCMDCNSKCDRQALAL